MKSQSATKNDANPINIAYLTAWMVRGTVRMVGKAFDHLTIDHRTATATGHHTGQFSF